MAELQSLERRGLTPAPTRRPWAAHGLASVIMRTLCVVLHNAIINIIPVSTANTKLTQCYSSCDEKMKFVQEK